MIILISTSGGIGGFGLARSVEITTDSLPEPLRTETCARLDAHALEALPPRPAPRGVADFVVYHIVVEEGPARAEFDLPETALPAATLDLIDRLLDRDG